MSEQADQPSPLDADEAAALKAAAVKRILVALDASLQSLAALDAAVELAIALHAELEGLFVEDIQLLHAAALPFAREIRYLSSQSHALETEAMERELRVQAERARQQIERRLAEKPISWQFRVARGGVAREVLQAAGEADLLVLGRSSRPHRRRGALGSTARAALRGAVRPVLVVYPTARLDRPMLFVVYDGSDVGQRAVELALRLSQAEGQLHLLLVADDDAAAGQLHTTLVEAVGLLPEASEFSRIAAESLVAMLIQLPPADVRALVIPVGSETIAEEPLHQLTDAIVYPILIVR